MHFKSCSLKGPLKRSGASGLPAICVKVLNYIWNKISYFDIKINSCKYKRKKFQLISIRIWIYELKYVTLCGFSKTLACCKLHLNVKLNINPKGSSVEMQRINVLHRTPPDPYNLLKLNLSNTGIQCTINLISQWTWN